MQNDESGDLLVFNGEIYNAPQLAAELSSEGVRFRGHSDTEVLLHALRRWGIDCLGRVEGMYAFAWLDRPSNRVFLARDPLGIKPLYVAHVGQHLLFASEVKAMIASRQVSTELDPGGVSSLLAYGSTQAPWTLFREIRVFPAGHWQCFDLNPAAVQQSPQPHWRFPRPADDVVVEDVPAMVRSQLTASVQSHLLSDVPVGVFLSSGLDSTLVAALAAGQQPDLRAFTVGFEDAADHSEAELAAATARSLELPHEILWLQQKDALNTVQPWLESLDQPSMDGLNTYVISQRVREAGIVVALSGQGGDELFGGYPVFSDVPRLMRLLGGFQKVPSSLRAMVCRLASVGRGVAFREKLTDMAHIGADLTGLALQRRRCFSDAQIASLLIDEVASDQLANHYLDAGQFDGLAITEDDPIHAISILESRFYLGNTLLPVGDNAGMAHGLEIRVPMLDRPLLDQALGLPGKVRLPQRVANKPLLRQAFPDLLRPELLKQSKRGFILPVKRWMQASLRPMCESALDTLKAHSSFNAAGIDRIWETFLRDPENWIWSRVWLLVALGSYLQQLDSVAARETPNG